MNVKLKALRTFQGVEGKVRVGTIFPTTEKRAAYLTERVKPPLAVRLDALPAAPKNTAEERGPLGLDGGLEDGEEVHASSSRAGRRRRGARSRSRDGEDE